MDERDARILFNLCPSLGPARFAAVLRRFGSAAAALAAPADGLGPWDREGRASRFLAREGARALATEKERVLRSGARVLISTDAEYPEAFRRLEDAPVALTVRGRLLPVDGLGIGVVGSRRPSPYGRQAAGRLARELASTGISVVSGLARGIDGEAHAAALSAGGRTVGILGSGLDRFYPPEHRRLGDRMAEKGAVLSEFPMAAPPDPAHFPRRNRLIAALSLGVVVVEARERSGALITARLAADLGRDVFAVPGSIFSPLSRGPHGLLRDGARPVEGAIDVVEEVAALRGLASGPARTGPLAPEPAGVSPPAAALRRLLSGVPAGVDALAAGAGLTAAQALRALLELELKGWARERPGKQYVRADGAPAGRP